jgi:hypothetical protein
VRNASVSAGHLVAKVGTPKTGSTISQQAVVHPWLAADAQNNNNNNNNNNNS